MNSTTRAKVPWINGAVEDALAEHCASGKWSGTADSFVAGAIAMARSLGITVDGKYHVEVSNTFGGSRKVDVHIQCHGLGQARDCFLSLVEKYGADKRDVELYEVQDAVRRIYGKWSGAVVVKCVNKSAGGT